MPSTSHPGDVEFFSKTLSSTASVVTPASENYKPSLARWSLSAERPASIIVFPATTDDVSKAVLFAQANSLEIAVKGGGHATSGSSSTDGGLVIDLGKMRGVKVNVENKTVTVQGGALWADVDAEAIKYQLACVGGTVNHTGVGGLTLGGGYGHLTGERGLVIDNLLSLEYVLADGSIVTISATENPDLFWAVRGAGSNFGVATSFTFQAHDQKEEIWGGLILLPTSELEKVINFANHAISLGAGKHTVVVAIAAPPPEGTPKLMALLVYNGPTAEAKEFYAPLLTLPSIMLDTTHSMPYDQVNGLLNDGLGPGLRRTLKGSSFCLPLSLPQAQSWLSDFESFLASVPDAIGTLILIEFVLYEKVLSIGQTDTAFANRGAYGNVTFCPGWTDVKFDDVCRDWSRETGGKTRDIMMRYLKEGGGVDAVTRKAVGEYANHDGLGSSGQQLFGVNYPRLQSLKKMYDPKNVFSKGPNLLV